MREQAGTVKRYAPWLQKALRIKDETQAFWEKESTKHCAKADDNALEAKELAEPQLSPSKSKSTVWDAVEADDVDEMQRFLETGAASIFIRRESSVDVKSSSGGGGVTLLHEAAFHGSANVAGWLVEHLEQKCSSESRRDFVNAVDTTYSQTTPLIAACRGAKGDVKRRLQIVQLLVQAGADVERCDSHGDNAIHWCARTSNNVLLRWLLKATDAGANAVFAENHKREKPLDIAKRVLTTASKSGGFSAQSVFNSLRSVDRKCNMRLKMQVIKRHMTKLHSEQIAAVDAQCASISTEVDDTIDKVERLWKETVKRAEESRKEAEAAFAKKATEAAHDEAIQWLDTKDGKSYVKNQFSTATEELKLEIARGRITKPKDMKKAATFRACETYIHQQEEAAGKLAHSNFTAKRPPLPSENDKLRAMLG